MATNAAYKPTYDASRALVIGINDYQIASPLSFARQDAEAFADILKTTFGFPDDKVALLINERATRQEIFSAFMRFTEDSVGGDDRIVVFFAGHGCTRTGTRGEVGFLVPVDGNPNDLRTLIRWDDFTRNAELIQAKHVLFLMDACYGGLAIRRNTPPGSARFLKDMLQRYARQVLTAGKANETVADSGGPRPDHSIFTGHLLDALGGMAADSNGIISANAVMAYVYDHVAKDPHSRQSPHFGFLEGDGDFIFSAPNLAELRKNEREDQDVLVQVPASVTPATELWDRSALVDRVKDYISEPRYRIRLDDLVASEIRAASYEIREDQFPLQTATVTSDDIVQRLRRYESVLSRLMAVTILLGRWGTVEHQPLIERIVARLADGTEPRSGKTAWLGLRWYPIMLLLYSGGVAALSVNNYATLLTMLTTRLHGSNTGEKSQPAIVSTVDGILEVDRLDLFKTLPGFEKYYVPRSEYLFKTLQPELEDLLFLGNGYEGLFDHFEIFYALTYLDFREEKSYVWAPPGRFGWKGRYGRGPYSEMVKEAKQYGNAWGPISAGLFSRSVERFNDLATIFEDQVLNKLPAW
jgi:uncharacterized caspase-like protein